MHAHAYGTVNNIFHPLVGHVFAAHTAITNGAWMRRRIGWGFAQPRELGDWLISVRYSTRRPHVLVYAAIFTSLVPDMVRGIPSISSPSTHRSGGAEVKAPKPIKLFHFRARIRGSSSSRSAFMVAITIPWHPLKEEHDSLRLNLRRCLED